MIDREYKVEVLASETSRWTLDAQGFTSLETAIDSARKRVTWGAYSARVVQVVEQEVWRGLQDQPCRHITEIVPNAIPNFEKQFRTI